VIAGWTRFVNKGHIARAVLEATAFQVREVVDAMASSSSSSGSSSNDSGITLDVLRADGGMVVNDLLMQFQSDILAKPVVRPMVKETTALGAAYAAGLAVDQRWEPKMDEVTRERLYRFWKKAVTRAFDWVEPA
jgi:glycerol kinase